MHQRLLFVPVLTLLALALTTATVDAAKITLEKKPVFSDEDAFLGYEDPDPTVLTLLGFSTIADYPSYLAGEVSEEDLDRFTQEATDHGMMFEVRRDFELIRINGYSFSSFGGPVGLPQDLTLGEYDEDIGLYLVQFKAPMTRRWCSSLASASEIISYFPQNSYLVRADADAVSVLARLDGVQHVSLFQPAYKIRSSLLDRDEPLDVAIEFDAGQDLTPVATFIESLTSVRPDVQGDSRFAYTRAAVTQAHLRTIARRPEVLWIEPALIPVFSGEREATVAAGQHDGESPLNAGDRPIRFYPDGHHSWLRDNGFCTPTEWDPYPGCMVYWTKVGVIDSGLDETKCLVNHYDEHTGICTQWHPDSERHPDLNHSSNNPAACPPPGEGIASIESADDCDDPVIRETVFCSGDLGENHCEPAFPWIDYYDFSDVIGVAYAGHGTAVASIIVGDPLSIASGDTDPPATYLDDYYLGTGIAPSAQLIIGKFPYLADNPSSTSGMTQLHFRDLVKKINDNGNGARIFNNSWNVVELIDDYTPGGYAGEFATEYSLFSRMADRLVRDAHFGGPLNETTLVFSAGNWDGNPEGQTQWTTSPGNAKNVISVGASRGWAEGGVTAHVDCTFEEHLIRDVAGGITGTWHSRRGYINEAGSAQDLPRFKPDLVAPGTLVAAARSQHSSDTDIYRCFRGSSAAAPVVTGAAVLAEAWYFYTIGGELELPSPAMIKAMLVAHADSLTGGTDHWPPTTSLGHSPSMAQGWGRVNLDQLFQEDVTVATFDQDHDPAPGGQGRRFTASGQYWWTQLQVDDPTKDIIAVLVFTDAPSNAGAASLKVNDLDLTLYRPSFIPANWRSYCGNHFEQASWYSEDIAGKILPALPTDTHNTVEVIRVPAGVLNGPFSVRVTARTVQANAVPGFDGEAPNQDFALYVYNAVQ